jgi:hypothetical protein
VNPPDSDHQVTPWLAWSDATSHLTENIDWPIAKKAGLKKNVSHLVTLRTALYFFMWKEWYPWGHYIHISGKLKTAHDLLIKKEFGHLFPSEVVIIIFSFFI